MKFIVQKTALLDALTITGKCISKSMLPIMECYLFKVENNKLVITGGNLEVYMEKQIDIKSECTATVALGSDRLLGIIKGIEGEQPIQFTQTSDTQVTIEADCGKYVIAMEPGPDYQVLKNTQEIVFDIISDDLLAGIGKTIFACSTDSSRPALTGLYISFDEKLVTCTGTDSHKLATYSFPVEVDSRKSFIVPVKVLSILLGLTPNTNITIKLDSKSIVFEVNATTTLRSRLIDEQYPEYRAIIPRDNDKVVTVSRHRLLSSLKRVTQFCGDGHFTVRINIANEGLQLHAENYLGEHANETLPLDYAGDELTVNFNGKMLMSCLSNLTAEMLNVSFKAANRPFLVRTDDMDEATSNLMLMMPIGNN